MFMPMFSPSPLGVQLANRLQRFPLFEAKKVSFISFLDILRQGTCRLTLQKALLYIGKVE